MIIDTNILISAIDIGATDHELCLSSLFEASEIGELRANEIIFAEMSGRFPNAASVLVMFESLRVKMVRLSLAECHRAGQAFLEYRRRGGVRTAILPDFLVGAQAELRGWPLMTNDRTGFTSYFPMVDVIEPTKEPK